MKNISKQHFALLTVLFAMCQLAVMAADIKQIGTSGAGTSWATASLWSNNAAASAGNNYFTDGHTLRTPDGVGKTFTFGGDSLTISGSEDGVTRPRGSLTLKGSTIFVGNLFLGTGTVNNGVSAGTGDNRPATITVANLTILDVGTSSSAATFQGANTNNDLTVDVTNLLGSGFLQFTNPRSFSLSVGNAASFSGTLHVNQGTLTLTSDFIAPGATFSMASSGASLVLANNLTVASFAFGGTTLSEAGQSYTSADLNSRFGTTVFSGDGVVSISTIPEASTAAFWLGGVFLLLGCLARINRIDKAGGARV